MVKKRYRSLLDEGEWPAAQHAPDSKALNSKFGRVNKAQGPTAMEKLTGQVHALVQQLNGKIKCYNCGKEGHISRCRRSCTRHVVRIGDGSECSYECTLAIDRIRVTPGPINPSRSSTIGQERQAAFQQYYHNLWENKKDKKKEKMVVLP